MTDNLDAWSDALMHEAYRRTFRSMPGSVIHEQDGLLACVGTSASSVIVNTAFRLTTHLPPEAAVAALQHYYRQRRHGFSLIVAAHDDPALVAAAQAAGLEPVVTLQGMLLTEPVHRPVEPAGFETHRVRDQDRLAGYRTVISEAFSPDATALYADPASLSGQDRAGWVVEEDGEPAAAASVLLIGDGAVVTTVGTRPRFGRRGLGQYVTRMACAEAFASGARLVTLQASPEGVSVYERIGFRQVTSHTVLSEEFPT